MPDLLAAAAGGAVAAQGRWTIENAVALQAALAALAGRAGGLQLDLRELEALDTVGALLLLRGAAALKAAGMDIAIVGLSRPHAALLEVVGEAASGDAAAPLHPPASGGVLAKLGAASEARFDEAVRFTAFLG